MDAAVEVGTDMEVSTLRDVPKEWFDRAEALIPIVQKQFPAFRHMSRAAVLRFALQRGLETIEAERKSD